MKFAMSKKLTRLILMLSFLDIFGLMQSETQKGVESIAESLHTRSNLTKAVSLAIASVRSEGST
jgi:hypothetical protein